MILAERSAQAWLPAGGPRLRSRAMIRSRKVRFIEPHGRPGRPFNAWVSRWPLLGPITLASILEKRGFDVAVYNENLSGSLPDNAAAYADVCSADVVGISIMTPTASRGYQLAARIKRDAPNALVVFGGVHATFVPEEALEWGDVVVRGEGETVIEAIANGEIRHGIVNAPPLENLDSIPVLNHSLTIDFEKSVQSSRGRHMHKLPVMASRGCPHGCTYCSVSRMFGRRVRRQSVEKVRRDLCSYMAQGFRNVFFYDDNFTADRAWARQLMERLRPLRITFDAQTRADFHWADPYRKSLDKELLAAMRKGGGDVLYIGYETIDDSTAARWHKGYRGGGALRARLLEDTRILHDNGFWIHGMFVLGPQHGQAAADGIVQFARQSSLETMQISILTPFPGTPLYEEMRPYLLFSQYPSDWDFYDGTHCVYSNTALGLEAFQKAVLKAHRSFYRWGGWSARRIRGILEQKAPAPDKLAMLWANARNARRTLQAWRREIASFLDLARSRLAGAELAGQGA